jgi:hypothetical protein
MVALTGKAGKKRKKPPKRRLLIQLSRCGDSGRKAETGDQK